mmetsp:Transcript_56403/g.132278  ORF Transcript_56403/g.132278 Transcript_56403/m.132278 type:complete len:243 (+) Transcript_56403:109-837(+)|eukprot:6101715-Amphidinium_carterae.1
MSGNSSRLILVLQIQCERERARRLDEHVRCIGADDAELARRHRAHKVAAMYKQHGSGCSEHNATCHSCEDLSAETCSTTTTVDLESCSSGTGVPRCANERMLMACQKISVQGLRALLQHPAEDEMLHELLRVVLLLVGSVQDTSSPLARSHSLGECLVQGDIQAALHRTGHLVFAMQAFPSMIDQLPLATACKAGFLLASIAQEDLEDLSQRPGVESALCEWAQAAVALCSKSFEEALSSVS